MADYPVNFFIILPWPAGVDATAQAAFAAAYHADRAALEGRASSEADFDLLCLGIQVECQPSGWALQDDNGEGQITAAVRLISVVNDTTAHIGQAAYVKGLLAR